MPTLRVIRGFEVTPAMLESIASYHGAFDPESGHLVCHGYTLRAAIVEGRRSHPALIVDECVVVVGGEAVNELEEVGEPMDSLRLGPSGVVVGDSVLSNPWLYYVLGLARDFGVEPRLYSVSVEDNRALLVVYRGEGFAYAFLLLECRRNGEAPPTHT